MEAYNLFGFQVEIDELQQKNGTIKLMSGAANVKIADILLHWRKRRSYLLRSWKH